MNDQPADTANVALPDGALPYAVRADRYEAEAARLRGLLAEVIDHAFAPHVRSAVTVARIRRVFDRGAAEREGTAPPNPPADDNATHEANPAEPSALTLTYRFPRGV